MHDITAKAISGVSWSITQRLASQAIQFVVFLLLARLLAPKGFGLLALALVYVGLVQIFVEQGFGDAIVQRDKLPAEYLDTAFWGSTVSGVLFCAIGFVLSGWIALLFSQPELAPIIRWLSVIFVINGLTTVPQSLLRRAMEFKSLALRSIIQSSLSGGVALGMAWRGLGVWSLVGQQIVAAFVGLVILWRATSWRPGLRVSGACFKQLLRFGGNVSGVNLLNVVNRQADNLVIGYFLGPVALGYYTIAYQVLVTVSNLLVGTMNNVALPLFSRMRGDCARLCQMLHKLTRLTCAVSAPVFIGITALAPEAIGSCLGNKWQPSVPALQVLCLIGILYAGFYFHGPLLIAIGRPQWNLFLNAVQAVTNCGAFLIGVRWGIVGVATAYVLRAYLMSPVHFLVLRRELGLQPFAYLKQFLPCTAAVIAMGLSVMTLKTLLPLARPLMTIAMAVPLGAVIYSSLLLFLQAETRSDLESLWQLLLRRPLRSATSLATVH